jgi:hypothetical protein
MAKVQITTDGDNNQASRSIVRTSGGTVYVVSTTTNGTTVQMHKGNQSGIPTSFTLEDTITGLTGLKTGTTSATITTGDDIYVAYQVYDTAMGGDHSLYIVIFDTSTDTFGTPVSIHTTVGDATSTIHCNIAVDANDNIHVHFMDNIIDMGSVTYSSWYTNNITGGGTTFKTAFLAFAGSNVRLNASDIIIEDPDVSVGADRPIICGRTDDDSLYLGKGNALNATSFSVMDGGSSGWDTVNTYPGNLIKVASGTEAGMLVYQGTDLSNNIGTTYTFDYADTWVDANYNSSQQYNIANGTVWGALFTKDNVVYTLGKSNNNLVLWTKTDSFQYVEDTSGDFPEAMTDGKHICVRWSSKNLVSPEIMDYTWNESNVLYYNSLDLGGAPVRNVYTQGYIPQVLF